MGLNMQIETEIWHGSIRYIIFTHKRQDKYRTTITRIDTVNDFKTTLASVAFNKKYEAVKYHSDYVNLIG